MNKRTGRMMMSGDHDDDDLELLLTFKMWVDLLLDSIPNGNAISQSDHSSHFISFFPSLELPVIQ